MGSAIPVPDAAKQLMPNKFNDMRELHFWKLSHPVRHCSRMDAK